MPVPHRGHKFLILLLIPQLSYPFEYKRTFHKKLSWCLQKNGDNSSYISNAAKERKDEERRRMERISDVQIGKTSAKVGEKNFAIDVEKTQMDLLQNGLDVSERLIWELTEKGMNALRLLNLDEASAAFSRVYELKPTSYVWHYGIVLFYEEKMHQAADILARNAVHFESKFEEPASEERIWRDACEIKLLYRMSRKEKEMYCNDKNWITQINERINGKEPLRERRKVLKLVRELFQSTLEKDWCSMILCQVKLRLIAGERKHTSMKKDVKMWKHTSWFYLGLHYDSIGKIDESKACMKMALQQSIGGANGEDITKIFPLLHMSRRECYDDDGFDPDDQTLVPEIENMVGVEHIINEGVEDMTLTELQGSLQRKCLPNLGTKHQLGSRLRSWLMMEAEKYRSS